MPVDFGLAMRLPALIATALVWLSASTPFGGSSEIEIDDLVLPEDARAAADTSSPFAGTWIGRWDGILKTTLIVESVAANGEAKVVYSVAANPHMGFDRAWFRLDAKITGQEMVAEAPGFAIAFTASPTGRLRAVYGDGYSFAVLSRRDLTALTAPGATIDWGAGTSEQVRTDLVESGVPIDLETVFFRPAGPGPFPLAVVNHGSTGLGTNDQAFGQTWTNDWLADVLNEKGYLVALPQRRGRGRSDGLFDEGFGANRARGYTCETDGSLAGADRALDDLGAAITALRQRPDVVDGPILLSGVSRGGFVSAVYAGLNPDQIAGVINFVGGWSGELCDTADTINGTLARKAGGFDRPMLWLYGENDPFYSIAHSRSLLKTFREAGGTAEFHVLKVRGNGNGHWVLAIPPLWADKVERYLSNLAESAN